jgi:membrane protease YdiL (CAAX protease family)
LVPSPIAWPAKSWGIVLSLVVALGAVVVSLVPSLIYVVFLAVQGGYDPQHPMENLTVLLTAQVLTYLPAAIYFAAVLPPLAGVTLASLGFRAPTLRTIGIGVLGAVVMTIAVDLAGAIVVGITHSHDTETAIALLQSLHTRGEKLNFFLVAVILAPMVEELAFRVFAFNALSRYMSIGTAALVSGALFGLVHVIGSPASQIVSIAIPLAVGGVILAYVYATARNYWSSVITHCLFNAVSVVGILVFHLKQ